MINWTRKDDSLHIAFPHTKLAFALEGDHLLGLGAVHDHHLPLRNDRQLLRPWIESIAGVVYTRFVLERIEEADGELLLHTAAHGVHRHESPYGDQYNDHLFLVSEQQAPVEDRLIWHLRPEKTEIGGLVYGGFSYAWSFVSATQKLHRIICQGSWEIGGRASGNTVLSQGQVTPAVYEATRDNHFTSACLQSLTRFGDPTAMSFQFVPRWGAHQIFDFLAHPRGTLLGYWPEKHDTRSFLQKNPGEETIFVIDAMHWQATGKVTTPRKHILFAPAEELPPHEARNRWYAANGLCTSVSRNLYGIKRSRPMPERTVPYQQRLREDGVFELKVMDEWVTSQDWLATIADKVLPIYRQRGIRRVMTEPIVESDPTERGLDTHLGVHGLHNDLNVGSVCCVHRYRPSAFFGGMDAWRYFCRKAHELGMEVGHWIGPHLAYHAPILKEHPEWVLRTFASLPAAGGYPNFELACLNWNTPVRQWILDDLATMRQEAGLDYVWFDSLANLGMLPVDFAQEMATNTDALLEFMADLQHIGIEHIAVEGMSAVAMSGAHIMDHERDHDGGVQWIAGQNSWLWYEGNEDMLIDQQPRSWVHSSRDEENVRHRLFRCLANRCVPELIGHTDKPWYREQIEGYLAVEAELGQRRLLENGQGIEWSSPAGRILFAFGPFRYALPANSQVAIWEKGAFAELPAADCLDPPSLALYRIRHS